MVTQTVPFRQQADHPAGIPRRKGTGRNILYNDTARSNYTAIPYTDAGADDYIGAQPAVVADADRLCITHMLRLPILIQDGSSLLRQHGVYRRNNGHIRAKAAAVPNGNFGVILHGKIKIRKMCIRDRFGIMSSRPWEAV